MGIGWESSWIEVGNLIYRFFKILYKQNLVVECQMIQIHEYKESDPDRVQALFYDTFFPIFGKEAYPSLLTEFRNDASAGRVFVALSSGDVVGLACYVLLEDDSVTKVNLERDLAWAKDRRNESALVGFLKQKQAELGKGEVIVQFYENAFTRDEVVVQDKDMYFSALAVHPDYRSKGIGEALTKKRIEIAKEKGSSAIFVHCWEGGHVSRLYEKLGFLPIIKDGPTFPDGAAKKVMGMFVK